MHRSRSCRPIGFASDSIQRRSPVGNDWTEGRFACPTSCFGAMTLPAPTPKSLRRRSSTDETSGESESRAQRGRKCQRPQSDGKSPVRLGPFLCTRKSRGQYRLSGMYRIRMCRCGGTQCRCSWLLSLTIALCAWNGSRGSRSSRVPPPPAGRGGSPSCQRRR